MTIRGSKDNQIYTLKGRGAVQKNLTLTYVLWVRGIIIFFFSLSYIYEYVILKHKREFNSK